MKPVSKVAVLVFVTSLGLTALAQGVATQVATPSKAGLAQPELSKPFWTHLSQAQREALEPLSQLWPTMKETHKRKWIALSRNFQQLSGEEQTVLQGRMREWSVLTPQQRTFARLNFVDFKKLPADEKRAKWEAYQALSKKDKQKLAKRDTKPLRGAAPAIQQPAARVQVAAPAASGGSNKLLPRIDTAHLSPTTLMPLATAASPDANTPPSEPAIQRQ